MRKLTLFFILLTFIGCGSKNQDLSQKELMVYNFFMSVHLEQTFRGTLIKENNTFMESQYKTTCLRLIERMRGTTPISQTKGRDRVPGILENYNLTLEKEGEIYQFISQPDNWKKAISLINQSVREFNSRNFKSELIPYYYITSYIIGNLNKPIINIFNENYSKADQKICNRFVTSDKVQNAIQNYNSSVLDK